MKKILLLVFSLLISTSSVYADARSYTYRSGIYTQYGFIPTSVYGGYTDCDPYMIYVERQKYYLIIDDGRAYNRKSLLGCGVYEKESLFTPLESLNSDNDKYNLTPEELKKANVRFVKLKTSGTLDLYNKDSDFDLDRIVYIDLRHLRFATTFSPSGSFDVYLKTSTKNLKKVIGKVEARTHHYVDRMFW